MTNYIADQIARGRHSDAFMYALDIQTEKRWSESCTVFTFFDGSKAQLHRHLPWCISQGNWITLIDDIPEKLLQKDWYFYRPRRKMRKFL